MKEGVWYQEKSERLPFGFEVRNSVFVWLVRCSLTSKPYKVLPGDLLKTREPDGLLPLRKKIRTPIPEETSYEPMPF